MAPGAAPPPSVRPLQRRAALSPRPRCARAGASQTRRRQTRPGGADPDFAGNILRSDGAQFGGVLSERLLLAVSV